MTSIANRTSTLRLYREYELAKIAEQIRPASRILEIGAGSGWQAALLTARGHHVEALDITGSQQISMKVYPVRVYDGYRLPYADNSFDIVFSSNVLEHIRHLNDFEREMFRVLKSDGAAIHVLPTSSWRVWTSATHCLYVLRSALGMLRQKSSNINGSQPRMRVPWIYVLWPNRHGEQGNSLSEIYRFSRRAWLRHFRRTGWIVETSFRTGIFYTGNQILHRHVSLPVREGLARLMGSATQVFVLRKTPKTI